MAAPDARLDSDNGTIIEIKGGSLVSFAPSVPFAVSEDSSDNHKEQEADEPVPDGGKANTAGKARPGASRVTMSSTTSVRKTTAASKTSSLRNADGVSSIKGSKSRVTIASDVGSPVRGQRSSESSIASGLARFDRRQRSIYSLVGQSEADADLDALEDDSDGGGFRDMKQAAIAFGGHLGVVQREKIPDGLAKLLRDLPEPRDLAPLVRSVIISADTPSRHVMSFKSTTKVQRVGLRPAVHVARAAKVRIGRQRREGQGVMFEPTYRAEPAVVPDRLRVRAIMEEIMTVALKGVNYSSYLAENGSRILAAAIVTKLKSFNFDRYRLAAQVRIAQKLNQGMAMYVAYLWHADVDRLSYVQYESPSLVAQAVLFLVYRD